MLLNGGVEVNENGLTLTATAKLICSKIILSSCSVFSFALIVLMFFSSHLVLAGLPTPTPTVTPMPTANLMIEKEVEPGSCPIPIGTPSPITFDIVLDQTTPGNQAFNVRLEDAIPENSDPVTVVPPSPTCDFQMGDLQF
jgi:hypothetical protein